MSSPLAPLTIGKVSWQATTTWKASTDPDFIAKMHRVLALYDTPPADGRVICVDEFGPLNLQLRKGRAWRPVGKVRRLRATYNRYGGVMHMLAALDLATGKEPVSKLGQGGATTGRVMLHSWTTRRAQWR